MNIFLPKSFILKQNEMSPEMGRGAMDISNDKINDVNQLECAIFCIENVADALHTDPQQVYRAITEESDILYNNILPEYEMLHTQSKEYIVADILEVMKEKGVAV